MVLGIRVVIGHALPAKIVICALHPPGNLLCTAVVHTVVEGLSAIMLPLAHGGRGATQDGQRYEQELGEAHVLISGTIPGTDSDLNRTKWEDGFAAGVVGQFPVTELYVHVTARESGSTITSESPTIRPDCGGERTSIFRENPSADTASISPVRAKLPASWRTPLLHVFLACPRCFC